MDCPDGALVVDASGRILAAGPFEAVAAAHPSELVQDLRPFWILPGLIDLHSHLPQLEAVAMDGLPLLPWLETHIFPAELRFQDASLATLAARAYFRTQLSLGTTTAAVYCTIHAEATHNAFLEAEACGIRGILGKVMMDRNAPAGLCEDTEASLAESLALCDTWHGRDHGRLQYAFTPRFAPTCTAPLLAGAGRLAERAGAYVQTHLSENLQELAWVKELFPESRNYTDVYARAGLLGPRTLLGHGIHLAPEERAAIRAAGATIVHCPRSNAFLQSGIMPLRRWLEEGLSVGLGTDVGAGPSLDLWSEMAFACMASKLHFAGQQNVSARLALLETLPEAQRALVAAALDLAPEPPIDPAQALRLATLDGARALGLAAVTGSLEAGKEADFIVVDPRRVDPAPARASEPTHQVLSRLLYRADPAMIRATYVRGRLCHALEA
jgi:guanine deaminase